MGEIDGRLRPFEPAPTVAAPWETLGAAGRSLRAALVCVGKWLVTAETDPPRVVLLDRASGGARGEVPCPFFPMELHPLPDGRVLLLGVFGAVAALDPERGRVAAWRVGSGDSLGGQVLAVADGAVYVCDADKARQCRLRRWRPGKEPTELLALPRWARRGAVLSGSRVALETSAGVELWDLTEGRPVVTLAGPGTELTALTPWRDGLFLAADGIGRLHLGDAERGAWVQVLHGHTAAVEGVSVAPGGRVVTFARDRAVRVWDPAEGALVASRALYTGGTFVLALALEPGGRTAVTVESDGALRRWDLEAPPNPAWSGTHTQGVARSCPSFGRLYAAGDAAHALHADLGDVEVFDARTARFACRLWNTRDVKAVSAGPAGSTLLVSNPGPWALLAWDGDPSAAPRELARSKTTERVHAVAFTVDRTRVLVAALERVDALTDYSRFHARLLDAATGARLGEVLFDDSPGPVEVALLGDRSLLVLGGTLEVWDLLTGAREREGASPAAGVQALHPAPDGVHVLALGDGLLGAVDRRDPALAVRALDDPPRARGPWCFAPGTSATILCADRAGALRRYDLDRGLLRWRRAIHEGEVRAVAWLDGERVVSCGTDGLVQVSSALDGSPLASWRGSAPMDAVTCVARRVLCGDREGRLRFLDLD
ncbi:MAG: WD40 repeat domain-containing protein [Deltaproteobacteria bacterium]|nr:WD40 repeat domain-containing protein [Deltaproteobacteria bacterium]